jgi:cardiolipin synthase
MFFFILSIIANLIVLVLLLLVLFEPSLRYKVQALDVPLDSERFLCLLGALADAQVHRDSQVEVLTNAEHFYEAQLQAIAAARRSVHLEAFIFHKTPIGDRFLSAMTERARAGVKVKLVLDAIGSLHTPDSYFSELRQAGGRVQWYQPITFATLKRVNNRTHRELMVVDGTVGFIGGAGISSYWTDSQDGRPPWRDTVCRVTGNLVTGLQTTFAENWLESSQEILAGEEYFPRCASAASMREDPNEQHSESQPDRETLGLVVVSTPSAARSTRARILFQTLLASAQKTIHINSPYFLPDRSASDELVRAVKRGVSVKVIAPGRANNHSMTRRSSRRRYGQLLQNGVEIYEYQPGMIHAKILIVDGLWSVVGSTNFDTRSFGLNDEVNLAALSPALASRLGRDFQHDLSQSEQITYEQWLHRPLAERVMAMLGRIFERQE